MLQNKWIHANIFSCTIWTFCDQSYQRLSQRSTCLDLEPPPPFPTPSPFLTSSHTVQEITGNPFDSITDESALKITIITDNFCVALKSRVQPDRSCELDPVPIRPACMCMCTFMHAHGVRVRLCMHMCVCMQRSAYCMHEWFASTSHIALIWWLLFCFN